MANLVAFVDYWAAILCVRLCGRSWRYSVLGDVRHYCVEVSLGRSVWRLTVSHLALRFQTVERS